MSTETAYGSTGNTSNKQPTDASNSAKGDGAASPSDGGKARIMSHMTKDHALSLFDYLNAYCAMNIDPDDPKSSVKMIDITNDHMTLEYTWKGSPNAQKAEIAINPPMNSLRDARTSLVKMAQEAAGSRGYATNRISTYESPFTNVRDVVTMAIVLVAVIPTLRNSLLELIPNNGEPDSALNSFIAFSKDAGWIPAVVAAAIHVGEAVFLLKPKIVKYRVPEPQRTWWYLSVLVEGFPAIRRFSKAIRKLEGKH